MYCCDWGYLTTLLYGCETWTIYRRHEKLLQQFHFRCFRNMFNICCQDKIPDTNILERADLPSIITIMRKAQTRWAEHVSRMSDCRIPKQLLYRELSHGSRKVGVQRSSYFSATITEYWYSVLASQTTYGYTALPLKHLMLLWSYSITSRRTTYAGKPVQVSIHIIR